MCDTLMKYLYKGMAQGAPTGSEPRTSTAGGRNTTPQATGGFTQAGGRSFGGAEGGSQAMSVLLSWHEKVSVPSYGRLMGSQTNTYQLVELAGPGSIVRVMSDRRTA